MCVCVCERERERERAVEYMFVQCLCVTVQSFGITERETKSEGMFVCRVISASLNEYFPVCVRRTEWVSVGV